MEKESDKWRKAAQQADNDLSALGYLTKELRAKRSEKFEDKYYDLLLGTVGTIHSINDGQHYIFEYPPYGKMTFYPKANKLHIHRSNKWIKPGLNWIINKIIKYNQLKIIDQNESIKKTL